MPRGITDQFLRILDAEVRRAAVVLALAVPAFLLALFLADLADAPRFGEVTAAYAGAVLLASVAAGVWAWRAATARTRALADQWQAWMRFSVGSASIDEIERKLRNRTPRVPWLAGLLVGLFVVANALVFALLWFETAGAIAAALLMALANGVGIGVLVGTGALRLYWARSATEAAQELVGAGAISVWGER